MQKVARIGLCNKYIIPCNYVLCVAIYITTVKKNKYFGQFMNKYRDTILNTTL